MMLGTIGLWFWRPKKRRNYDIQYLQILGKKCTQKQLVFLLGEQCFLILLRVAYELPTCTGFSLWTYFCRLREVGLEFYDTLQTPYEDFNQRKFLDWVVFGPFRRKRLGFALKKLNVLLGSSWSANNLITLRQYHLALESDH